MARPKKQTVDYFPHMCSHKKTIFIIEQKYGNDGYAFWFKLLEILGDTEGHYIDINEDTAWEFLQAKTHIGEDLCIDILNLLAKLEAIDPDLWEEKVIWSQNFVDGISDVYKNRRVDIPAKPSFYNRKPKQIDISTDENPQSKVKETKVKETITTPISPSEKFEEQFSDSRDIFKSFEKEFGRLLSPFEIEMLRSWINTFNADLILYALKIATLGQNRSFRYIQGILTRWQGEGVKCVQEVEILEKRHQEEKRKRAGPVKNTSVADQNKNVLEAVFGGQE